jgi:TetR/AcrR family transcriptional regulator, mexJK operon transcriptional repressor
MKTETSNADFAASAPPSKRLAARRAAFLSAAREVFQQKGYAEATLDDVIARSGGSRQTLYALFGGKQGLFEALVTETCWSIFGKLTPERLASQSPDLVLTEVGVRYLEIVLSPQVLSLTRLVVAEASRIPEIAETYWRLGPGRSRAFLTEFFERQIARGLLEIADSRKGADHFLEMLSGTIRFQCLTGVRQPPDGAEIREIVACAVAQFLHGCVKGQGAAPASDKMEPPASA